MSIEPGYLVASLFGAAGGWFLRGAIEAWLASRKGRGSEAMSHAWHLVKITGNGTPYCHTCQAWLTKPTCHDPRPCDGRCAFAVQAVA